MITVKNIINFYEALNGHITEEQIYELVIFMKTHIHNFSSEVNEFYCNILKEEYFNVASELSKISHGGENELRKFSRDIYKYCLLKFQ